VDAYLIGKYGKEANVPQILSQVEQMGAQVGLVYKMSNTQAGDTTDAHRIVHLAQSVGLQMQAVDRIHKAHFTEEANIFDLDVLTHLAVNVGLDPNRVISVLDSDEYTAEVEEDDIALRKMGISSIPFFSIHNQVKVKGVQPPEHFRAMLDKVWENENGL